MLVDRDVIIVGFFPRLKNTKKMQKYELDFVYQQDI